MAVTKAQGSHAPIYGNVFKESLIKLVPQEKAGWKTRILCYRNWCNFIHFCSGLEGAEVACLRRAGGLGSGLSSRVCNLSICKKNIKLVVNLLLWIG